MPGCVVGGGGDWPLPGWVVVLGGVIVVGWLGGVVVVGLSGVVAAGAAGRLVGFSFTTGAGAAALAAAACAWPESTKEIAVQATTSETATRTHQSVLLFTPRLLTLFRLCERIDLHTTPVLLSVET